MDKTWLRVVHTDVQPVLTLSCCKETLTRTKKIYRQILAERLHLMIKTGLALLKHSYALKGLKELSNSMSFRI
jgi:hypothetical protein